MRTAAQITPSAMIPTAVAVTRNGVLCGFCVDASGAAGSDAAGGGPAGRGGGAGGDAAGGDAAGGDAVGGDAAGGGAAGAGGASNGGGAGGASLKCARSSAIVGRRPGSRFKHR